MADGSDGGALVAAVLGWGCLRPEVDPLTGAVTAPARDFGANAAELAALEHALRLAEHWEGRVLAVVAGPPAADTLLREALACGADEVVRVEAAAGGPAGDGRPAARAIADALRRADFVFCGDRSASRGTGAVPAFLAAELEAAQALGVVEVHTETEGTLLVHRRLDGGRREVLRVRSPGVVSVEAAGVRLRRAGLRATLDAATAEIPVRPGPSGGGPRVLGTHPFRPRPHVLPPPGDADPAQRVLALTGALGERTAPTVLGPLEPAEAADELLGYLRKHGYLADDGPS